MSKKLFPYLAIPASPKSIPAAYAYSLRPHRSAGKLRGARQTQLFRNRHGHPLPAAGSRISRTLSAGLQSGNFD